MGLSTYRLIAMMSNHKSITYNDRRWAICHEEIEQAPRVKDREQAEAREDVTRMAETPFRRIKAVWEPVKARVGVQVKVPAVVMAGEQAAGPVEVPDKDEADALRILIFNRHSTCVISQ
jgi:hypothetical protein